MQPAQPTKYDVVIVGAGIAGLAAAAKCRAEGKSFVILEAQDHVGGRALSEKTEHGNTINVGANWLHGRDNDRITAVAEELGFALDKSDTADENVISFHKGKAHDRAGTTFGFRSRVQAGGAVQSLLRLPKMIFGKQDMSMQELLYGDKPNQERIELSRYMRVYAGDDSSDISAKEGLRDPFGPGGYQIVEGMSEFVDRYIKQKVGYEHIQLNTPVAKIIDTAHGATVLTKDNQEIHGTTVMFTGSLGVLKNNAIGVEDESGHSLLNKGEIGRQLSTMKMGNLAKLVFEVDKEYLKQHPELVNRNIDYIDSNPKMFCHALSAGKPVITVIFGGDDAINLDKIAANPAMLENIMSNIEREGSGLEDFRKHLIDPKPKVIQACVKNEYIQGAYSNCTVDGKRVGPQEAGNHILIAGEAFGEEESAYLSGAYKSGEMAAVMAFEKIALQHEKSLLPKWTDRVRQPVTQLQPAAAHSF